MESKEKQKEDTLFITQYLASSKMFFFFFFFGGGWGGRRVQFKIITDILELNQDNETGKIKERHQVFVLQIVIWKHLAVHDIMMALYFLRNKFYTLSQPNKSKRKRDALRPLPKGSSLLLSLYLPFYYLCNKNKNKI